MTEALVIGVDGCSAGWIAIALGRDTIAARVHATFDDLVRSWLTATTIAVDIPIGLVERGWRAADLAAKDYLKKQGRSSSLFLVPSRLVFKAKTHEEACRLARKYCGAGISVQSFGLFKKILEVGHHVSDRRLIEVHPEASFSVMARGNGPLASKKTWSGTETRRQLLAKEGIQIPARFDGDDRVGVDDVLDAAAAAWSGRRWLCNHALEFPTKSPDVDASGREIRIVA